MNLFVNLAQSIQLKLFKSSKEYKKRNLPIDMADVLANASRILVCLPHAPVQAESAARIVGKLSSGFPHWRLTILTSAGTMPAFLNTAKYNIISYSEQDVTKSQKPKKAFLTHALDSAYDVAIDLSIPFSFTNLVFIWLANAKLRVGFHHQDREALYNFLVRHKSDATVEYSYLSLVNYLQSFH